MSKVRSVPAAHPLPPPDCAAVLARVLHQRTETALQSLQRCRSRVSERSVHALRVATRRLLAVMDLVLVLTPSPLLKEQRVRLRRIIDELDSVRDTHVHILRVQECQAQFPEASRMLTVLRVREAGLIKKARRLVLRVSFEPVMDAAADAEARLRRLSAPPPLASAALSALFGAVDGAFLRVVDRYEELDPSRTASIHRMRLAFKKFRYMTEVLGEGLIRLPSGRAKELQAYQTLMGDIQDLEVLISAVEKLAGARRSPGGGSLRMHLVRRKEECVLAFLKNADRIFDLIPPAPRFVDSPRPQETPA